MGPLRVPWGRGLTLLELVVVLALVGLVSGLVLTGIGRGGAAQAESAAIREIERSLVTARVDAMRSGSEREVVVELLGESVLVRSGGRDRTVERGGLAMVDEDGRPLDVLAARFASDGRTDQRLWRMPGEGVDLQRAFDLGLLREAEYAEHLDEAVVDRTAAASGIGGRLWLIRFDPVSGAPRVQRIGEGGGRGR